jgi:outer membrane receptor protein involved in Fe transport
MNRTLPYLLSLLGLASITSASAQELTTTPPSESPAPTSEEVYVLDDFVVSTADDKGYYSANSTAATRSNELVKNTPITLTVVNEQLMQDLNILTDQDLSLVSPSVAYDPDGFSLNQIRIRGFRSLTSRYDWFWRELPRDGYNTARLDIVKGANSLLFGQADPGGKVNNVPKLAQRGKNITRLKMTDGSNAYRRYEADANVSVNDNLDLRFLGVDFRTEYDQDYRFREFTGGTLEASYRPSTKTELRLHFETVDTEQNFPARMLIDARHPSTFIGPTTDTDEAYNANGVKLSDGHTGIPSDPELGTELYFRPNGTTDDTARVNRERNANRLLSAFEQEGLLTPDYIDFLPDEVVQAVIDNSNGTINSRAELRALYDLGLEKEEINGVYGPDKRASNDGEFIIADLSHQITDDLQFKIAFNHVNQDRYNITRESYSANRVRTFPGDPDREYIQAFWRKQTGGTDSTAVRSTFLYDTEIKGSSHKFLFGYDFDRVEKKPMLYDQILKSVAEDNSFNGSYDQSALAWDAFTINEGWGPDRAGLRYDDTVHDPNGLIYTPNYGLTVNEFQGNDGDAAVWTPFRYTPSSVDTHGAWFAAQSQFLDGRLHTLGGIRYDKLFIESEFEDYSIFGRDGTGGDFEASPGISSAFDLFKHKTTYDQWSPSVGGIFWVTPELGVFANYAKSIQSPNGVDRQPTGEVAPPELGEGYEYGVRFEFMDGKLNGQVNAFYIEKENDRLVTYNGQELAVIYPLGSLPAAYNWAYKRPDGNVPTWDTQALKSQNTPGNRVPGTMSRSEGLEVEFFYNPNRNLTLMFAYAYINLDAHKVHESVEDIPNVGRIYGVAPHYANLMARYNFRSGALRGLAVGINHRWRSASIQNTYEVDGQFYDVEFDDEHTTGIFANWSKKLSSDRRAPKLTLGLRVNNLFDHDELINRNGTALYRDGRQVLLSGAIEF